MSSSYQGEFLSVGEVVEYKGQRKTVSDFIFTTSWEKPGTTVYIFFEDGTHNNGTGFEHITHKKTVSKKNMPCRSDGYPKTNWERKYRKAEKQLCKARTLLAQFKHHVDDAELTDEQVREFESQMEGHKEHRAEDLEDEVKKTKRDLTHVSSKIDDIKEMGGVPGENLKQRALELSERLARLEQTNVNDILDDRDLSDERLKTLTGNNVKDAAKELFRTLKNEADSVLSNKQGFQNMVNKFAKDIKGNIQ